MVYASSANPSGKGNRGKAEGIGERIDEQWLLSNLTKPLKLATSKV